jgi:hypothetical protein
MFLFPKVKARHSARALNQPTRFRHCKERDQQYRSHILAAGGSDSPWLVSKLITEFYYGDGWSDVVLVVDGEVVAVDLADWGSHGSLASEQWTTRRRDGKHRAAADADVQQWNLGRHGPHGIWSFMPPPRRNPDSRVQQTDEGAPARSCRDYRGPGLDLGRQNESDGDDSDLVRRTTRSRNPRSSSNPRSVDDARVRSRFNPAPALH